MMSSPSSNNSKWISYLAENLLEEPQAFNPFQWCSGQALPEQGDCSALLQQRDVMQLASANCTSKTLDEGNAVVFSGENDGSKVGSDDNEICPRKRFRDDTCNGAGNKACREKARRDRLNDRFLELSSAVEPGRAPKTDKATILGDAVRVLGQLRTEAQELKYSNHQLRETIKVLKTEKNELRDEKLRLKADKERLEQQLKAMTVPAGFLTHPATLHAAVAAYSAQAQAQAQAATKAPHMPAYPGMPMWQWMPSAAVDTSQDHLLRPPVA